VLHSKLLVHSRAAMRMASSVSFALSYILV
jgi:hypothetical protein